MRPRKSKPNQKNRALPSLREILPNLHSLQQIHRHLQHRLRENLKRGFGGRKRRLRKLPTLVT